jgi:hypothetical protein
MDIMTKENWRVIGKLSSVRTIKSPAIASFADMNLGPQLHVSPELQCQPLPSLTRPFLETSSAPKRYENVSLSDPTFPS